MQVKAKKDFSHTSLGNVAEGQVIEVTSAFARQLIEWKLAELVQAPKKQAAVSTGAAAPSQSSPVDQAQPKTKRKKSKKQGSAQ